MARRIHCRIPCRHFWFTLTHTFMHYFHVCSTPSLSSTATSCVLQIIPDDTIVTFTFIITAVSDLDFLAYSHQLEVLNNGLILHGKLAGPEVQPLHHTLQDMYNKMRSSMGYHVSHTSQEMSGTGMPGDKFENSTVVTMIICQGRACQLISLKILQLLLWLYVRDGHASR